MKSNENQWNSMEFPMRSKVVVYLGEIQEIPSKVLLTFWGGGVIEPGFALITINQHD